MTTHYNLIQPIGYDLYATRWDQEQAVRPCPVHKEEHLTKNRKQRLPGDLFAPPVATLLWQLEHREEVTNESTT